MDPSLPTKLWVSLQVIERANKKKENSLDLEGVRLFEATLDLAHDLKEQLNQTEKLLKELVEEKVAGHRAACQCDFCVMHHALEQP